MVEKIKEDNRIVLTLGGDHSIALGSVHGILKHYESAGGPTPCVLWIDAHADINTTVRKHTEMGMQQNLHIR